jgi:hypothetical protein
MGGRVITLEKLSRMKPVWNHFYFKIFKESAKKVNNKETLSIVLKK